MELGEMEIIMSELRTAPDEKAARLKMENIKTKIGSLVSKASAVPAVHGWVAVPGLAVAVGPAEPVVVAFGGHAYCLRLDRFPRVVSVIDLYLNLRGRHHGVYRVDGADVDAPCLYLNSLARVDWDGTVRIRAAEIGLHLGPALLVVHCLAVPEPVGVVVYRYAAHHYVAANVVPHVQSGGVNGVFRLVLANPQCTGD